MKREPRTVILREGRSPDRRTSSRGRDLSRFSPSKEVLRSSLRLSLRMTVPLAVVLAACTDHQPTPDGPRTTFDANAAMGYIRTQLDF